VAAGCVGVGYGVAGDGVIVAGDIGAAVRVVFDGGGDGYCDVVVDDDVVGVRWGWHCVECYCQS